MAACLILLTAAIGGSSGMAAAQNDAQYEAMIDAANSRLAGGDNIAAVIEAQNAIRLMPTRFEGHFFAAVALLRQGLVSEAEKYAAEAVRFAPPDRRADVDRLAAAVRQQTQAAGMADRAADARRKGEIFRAATLYLEAFELNPQKTEYGLEGARLFQTLKISSKAARIYRQLAASQNAAAKQEAAKQLKSLEPTLQEIWKHNVANGWRQFDAAMAVRVPAPDKLDMAIEAFERAIDANPGAGGPPGNDTRAGDSPYIGLAASQAARGNRAKLEAVLTQGAQNGLRPGATGYFDIDPRTCTLGCKRYEALAPHLCQADLQRLLQSVYGPPVERAARDVCTSRQARAEQTKIDDEKLRVQREKLKAEQDAANKRRLDAEAEAKERERLRLLAEAARIKRENEERERIAAERRVAEAKVYGALRGVIQAKSESCFAAKAKSDPIDICFCIDGYAEDKREIAYSYRFKGQREIKTPNGSVKYHLDAQASFETRAFTNDDFTGVTVVGSPKKIGSSRLETRYTSSKNEVVTGKEAFSQSSLLAAVGSSWAISVPEGIILLGHRNQSQSVMRAEKGCGMK